MSHITRVKTHFRDKDTLLSVLQGMGKTVSSPGKIRVWGDRREPVDIAVELPGQFDLGFTRRSDGYFYAVQDTMSRGATTSVQEIARRGKRVEEAERREQERQAREQAMKEQRRLEELERQARRDYALVTTLTQLSNDGFDIVERVNEEDGTVRLVARRWS